MADMAQTVPFVAMVVVATTPRAATLVAADLTV